MIINKTDTFTILKTFDENSGKNIITIFDFFEEFNENYTNFKSENIDTFLSSRIYLINPPFLGEPVTSKKN